MHDDMCPSSCAMLHLRRSPGTSEFTNIKGGIFLHHWLMASSFLVPNEHRYTIPPALSNCADKVLDGSKRQLPGRTNEASDPFCCLAVIDIEPGDPIIMLDLYTL